MNKLPLEVPELGLPQVILDRKILTTMTISYGHGISITPLHLASATSTIVNNGKKVDPTLLIDKPLATNRSFQKTSKKIRSIMRLVVSNKNGTAKKAEVSGYLIGGKTGTAEKLNRQEDILKKKI